MRCLGAAAVAAACLVLVPATEPVPVRHPSVPVLEPVAATAPIGLSPQLAAAAPSRVFAAPPRLVRRVIPERPGRRTGELPTNRYAGPGFDACAAPPIETLRAWHGTSPYGAIGIYVSGGQRACDQPQLTGAWVREARRLGWRLVPTHVGKQAPCSTNKRLPDRIDPANAVQQGQAEAADAVRAVRRLGLGRGTPVYLDIEAYPRGDSPCSQAVVDFTLGWTDALHRAGYHAGFYSSADSGITDLAVAARLGSAPLPDAIWYARWDDRAGTDDHGGPLADDLWADHQRIHQHHGDVQESYGGAALTIDRDQLDGLVAR